VWRIIFAFAKQGKAVFYPHLALVEIFTMAMTRAGIPARYTQGFNPQPHLEFAAPLPLGMAGQGEIAAIETRSFFSAQTFKQALCAQLPPGLTVGEAIPILIPWGVKKWSLASVLWGYSYETAQGDQQLVPAGMERAYRLSREGNLWGVQRRAVLAAAPQDRTSPASYFAVYREHYAGPWARRP
jgi:radical SAM-linked protein